MIHDEQDELVVSREVLREVSVHYALEAHLLLDGEVNFTVSRTLIRPSELSVDLMP